MQTERRSECRSDTQYKVMLSGYYWAYEQMNRLVSVDRVLDAACGSGYGSFYLAKEGKKVIGIDISKNAIKKCRKKYNHDNLKFLEMNCSNIVFNDNAFDAVVSQDTIEHVKDDKKFLSEIKRVLKPGGIAIIFTPHSPQHNNKPSNIYHLREYSQESFCELLRGYFSHIELYGRKLSVDLLKLEDDLNSVRQYDKLGIRRVIPRFLRHSMANLIARFKGDKKLESVNIEDIEYFSGVEGSSVLIAVCKNNE